MNFTAKVYCNISKQEGLKGKWEFIDKEDAWLYPVDTCYRIEDMSGRPWLHLVLSHDDGPIGQ